VSDTQARLDAIRGLVEGISWGGSTDISGNRDDVDRLIVDDVPWLLAELERVTAALREAERVQAALRERMEYVEGVLSRDPFDEKQRQFAAGLLRNTLPTIRRHEREPSPALAGAARAAQEDGA
jgi:hypothetical protein